MKLLNLFFIIVFSGVITGCSKKLITDQVLVDKRTVYQKSKDMTVLEIPPDLTMERGEYSVTIPGETESTSLNEFRRQREKRLKRGGVVLGSGEFENEQWLVLRGSVEEIWSKLLRFWDDNDFTVELDDAELGVIETTWKEIGFSRHKFRILAEPDEFGVTLFLSSDREERSDDIWLTAIPDKALEKETLRKINLYFYGDTPEATIAAGDNGNANAPGAVRLKANIINIAGTPHLTVPHNYTHAWHKIGLALQRSGYVINERTQETGTYHFLYFDPEASQKKRGLLSRLKFWEDDEDTGTPYRLKLDNINNDVRAVVMNNDGERLSDENAKAILETLRDTYNQL